MPMILTGGRNEPLLIVLPFAGDRRTMTWDYKTCPNFLLPCLLCVAISLFTTSWGVSQEAASKAKATTNEASTALRPLEDVAGLPRVLLIGDSISIGYTLPTRKLLEGKANVHRIPANGGPTIRGLESIDKWLGEKSWDVIHFNWGIHDLRHQPNGQRQVEPADYEANLRKLVARLKTTHAKLIWASITPIPKGKLNPDRTFGDEVEYNAIAAKVMNEHSIPINDLHGYIRPRFEELQRPSDLHYKPEGSDFLAQKVAEEIERALKKK
jgi:lysophospholipase L1-like esterase